MKLPSPLLEGQLLRRYKRFLADVRLTDGREVTAHCADPGRMTGLAIAESRVLLSESSDPRRRLRYSWELVWIGTTWVCVNTSRTNSIVREALEAGAIPELAGMAEIRAEVAPHTGSRLDFVLSDDACRVWVEVKNVTLAAGGVAMFPDAVTERGRKHLRDLRRVLAGSDRAAMLFVVNREDCVVFRPADDVDPAYADALREAARAGVEVLAYATRVSAEEICVDHPLPIEL